MDRAIITWDEEVVRAADVADDKHPLLRTRGFFALLAARLDEEADLWCDLEVVDMGYAFYDSLREGLLDDRRDFSASQTYAAERGKELIVMLGVLTDCSLGRITELFYGEVNACLISRNRPLCNSDRDKPYEGRQLSIVNRGDYKPMQHRVWTRTK
jgi:hypothetical protein